MTDDDREEEQRESEQDDSARRERQRRDSTETGSDGAEVDDTTATDSVPESSAPVENEQTARGTERNSGSEKSGRTDHTLPQVAVDSPARVESLKLTESMPETHAQSAETPQIGVSTTEPLAAVDLDAQVPLDTSPTDDDTTSATSFETSREQVPVPQIRADNARPVTGTQIHTDEPDSLNQVKRVRLPQVSARPRAPLRPFNDFVDTLPEATSTGLEPETETVVGGTEDDRERRREKGDGVSATATENTERSEATTATPAGEIGTGDNWASGEIPDPLERLFGSGGSDLQRDCPIVVLVDDSDLVGVVETVVKRLYREKVGGEPTSTKLSTAEQLADEERWVAADGRIVTVELPAAEWEAVEPGAEYHDEWQSIWRNRVDQLFSGQEYGAIVFNRGEIPVTDMTLPHHQPTVVRPQPAVEWKELLTTLFWTAEPERAEAARTFGQMVDWREDGIARRHLEDSRAAADGLFQFAVESDDDASEYHYTLKLFTVEWLARQLREEGAAFVEQDRLSDVDYREIEQEIPTEAHLGDGERGIRPDIMHDGRVFEVETFFGEGAGGGVGAKLQETVRKYEDIGAEVEEINIVFDHLSSLLHLPAIAQFERHHEQWQTDHVTVNLYTVDLGDGSLLPLSTVVDRLRELEEA